MSATRKLLTVFYADVAGYSRLTGDDEEGTHQRVMTILDHATAAIDAADGTVLRYSGDAILASFPSVVKAVETSVSIQNQLAGINRAQGDQEPIQIRIGINPRRSRVVFAYRRWSTGKWSERLMSSFTTVARSNSRTSRRRPGFTTGHPMDCSQRLQRT